ncbi:hypothetical protein RIF29_09901 [Crotalaria pallida]|uniref:acid phosphatase n=1 Tax=Crotalaria pallida TaxID=3830 RepID=A0AAN9FSD2_CROPI
MRNNDQGLWLDLLRAKYGVSDMRSSIVNIRATDSSLWKSILAVQCHLSKHEFWQVGNGTKIRLWDVKWLNMDQPLVNCHDVSIPSATRNWCVSNIMNANGDWDWTLANSLIPHHISIKLLSIAPPSVDENDDRPAWPGHPLGDFSMKRQHAASNIVSRIWNLLSHQWTVHITHIFREGNSCADILASVACSNELPLICFDQVPTCISLALAADVLGSYKEGEQYKWLERDLASVDREVTPWLVASWHAPWYSTYKAHYREAECMRVAMEDKLYTYGVDIIFNGHRSNRVYNYTLDPCGPVHIIVGDGGNREKMAITHAEEPGKCPEPSTTPDNYMGGFCAFNFTSGPAAEKFCWDRQPEYSAFRESSFGHGILEVKNETHALWTWHRNQDYYGSAGDAIYIVRQPQRCPLEPKVEL